MDENTQKNMEPKVPKKRNIWTRFWSGPYGHEIVGFFLGIAESNRDKATDQIKYEIREMEHMFTLMVFGDAVGLPSPPISVTMELLPLMTDDFEKMILRATQTGNGLSEIASIIGEP